MKSRRNAVWFTSLLIVGLIGYLLGRMAGPGPVRAAAPAGAKPDRVIAHFDFPKAVAWAGEGKWTIGSFLNDGIAGTEYKPLIPASDGAAAIKTLQYLARCDKPLTVDEQQSFFNRFVNWMSDDLAAKGAGPGGGGGGIGQLPFGDLRVYCNHSTFGTRGVSPYPTAGGTRGAATAFMVSDGSTSILFVTLTEVTPTD
jgi:hypothetical protein